MLVQRQKKQTSIANPCLACGHSREEHTNLRMIKRGWTCKHIFCACKCYKTREVARIKPKQATVYECVNLQLQIVFATANRQLAEKYIWGKIELRLRISHYDENGMQLHTRWLEME